MSAPSSRSRTFPDDGRPQAWQLRQVRPPYRREELEGTLEPMAVADGALLLHAADTITIVRVRGLRPFASTSWLTRVVGGGVSGPMVLEVLSLFPVGDGEGEIAFSPQFLSCFQLSKKWRFTTLPLSGRANRKKSLRRR